MTEPNWETCDEAEVWRYVATTLKRHGIDSVLVGGAVATIYTDGLYRSGDIDMLTYEQTIKDLEQALDSIGFKKKEMHYRHPKCDHIFLQIVAGPLGIGDDIQIKPRTDVVDGQVIKILTPTDCIRDRLMAFREDKTRDLLDLAVMVAMRHPFEDKKIRSWCKDEGMLDIYEEFVRVLILERGKKA